MGRKDRGAASAGKQHIGPPAAPGRRRRRPHRTAQRGRHGRASHRARCVTDAGMRIDLPAMMSVVMGPSTSPSSVRRRARAPYRDSKPICAIL